LVRMFEQALKAIVALEPSEQDAFVARLERVREGGHNWGWGVGDDMDDLMAEYGFVEERQEPE
jgi:phage-related protein